MGSWGDNLVCDASRLHGLQLLEASSRQIDRFGTQRTLPGRFDQNVLRDDHQNSRHDN